MLGQTSPIVPAEREHGRDDQHHRSVDGMKSDAHRPTAVEYAVHKNVLQRDLYEGERRHNDPAPAGSPHRQANTGSGTTSHWKILTQSL